MSLPNMHPADELAMIREDKRRLVAREAELRQGFLSLALDKHGEFASVSVKVRKERRLLKDRLPQDVLANAAYWETSVTRAVVVDGVDPDGGQPMHRKIPAEADVYDVIEQF